MKKTNYPFAFRQLLFLAAIALSIQMCKKDDMPPNPPTPCNLNPDFEIIGNYGFAPCTIMFKNTSDPINSAVHFSWNFGGLGTSQKQNPDSIVVQNPGTYTIKLTMTNGNCSEEISLNLTVYKRTFVFAPITQNFDEITACILEKPDGNYYLWSGTATETPNKCVIYELSKTGIEKSKQIIDGAPFSVELGPIRGIATSNWDGYAVAGNGIDAFGGRAIHLQESSSFTNSIYQKSFPNAIGVSGSDIVATQDGWLVGGISIEESGGNYKLKAILCYFSEFGSGFSKTWEDYIEISAVIELPNDNFGVAAKKLDGSYWFLTINGTGSVISAKSIPYFEYIADMVRLSDGNIAMTGRSGPDILLMKTSSSGDVIFSRGFPGGRNALSIDEFQGGDLLIVGEKGDFLTNNADIYILRVTSTGNIVWQKSYGGANNQTAGNGIVTSDGGVAVAGITYSPNQQEQDIYVLRLDGAGNQ